MGKTVALQKTVYLSGQDRDEGACVNPYWNSLERVHKEIMSDKRLERVFKPNPEKWDAYPAYENKEAKKDYFDFRGWNGLRKIFPFIDRDSNVECLVTVMFSKKDVCRYDEECQIDRYEKAGDNYNFHAESDFYGVTTGSGSVMLCKGENSLYWSTDDGYVKWDCDRENGGLICRDSPLEELFPESKTDGHSVEIPYKLRIIVDAII